MSPAGTNMTSPISTSLEQSARRSDCVTGAGEDQGNHPALTRDVPASHLPPLRQDILWLLLGFVQRPPAHMQCRVCALGFLPRIRLEATAWRIHSCGHYIHTECLGNVYTVRDGCQTCQSLHRQLESISREKREAKIARLEQALVPWKRDFR
jgi:hypothetical protein